MKLNVHDIGRNDTRLSLLVVTDQATYCEAKVERDDGFVSIFSGSVWPGELPEVFERRGQPTAIQPSVTYLRPEVLSHFRRSVGTLTFPQTPAAAARGSVKALFARS